MTESLKRVLDNPFLRESPFKSNQLFYSAPKKYQSDSYYKSSNKQTYNDLSAQNSSNQNISITTSKAQNGGQLKKKGNPFFRKNLISANKDMEDDYVQFQPINMSRNDNSRIKMPDYLNESKSSNISNVNQLIYRDLSYKVPPSGSKNCIILQTKPIQQMKGYHNKQNNLLSFGMGSRGHLVSPRFPSVKVIGENSNRVMVPQLTDLRSSLNKIQNSDRYSPNYLGHPTLNNNYSRPGSYKNLPDRQSEQFQAERDTVYKKPKLILPSDGNPNEINVRGNKYFRSAVQLTLTRA